MAAVQDLGTVEEREGRYRIRYERRLDHPVETVWAAVTDPAEMAKWWAEASVDLTVGGAVVLRWQNTEDGGEPTTARGTITVLDPPRVVEYDTDVHGRLRFELTPDGAATRLVFVVDIEMPAEHVDKNVAGWHIHLEHLADVLGGGTVDWPHWYAVHFPRWQEIHDEYVARAD